WGSHHDLHNGRSPAAVSVSLGAGGLLAARRALRRPPLRDQALAVWPPRRVTTKSAARSSTPWPEPAAAGVFRESRWAERWRSKKSWLHTWSIVRPNHPIP